MALLYPHVHPLSFDPDPSASPGGAAGSVHQIFAAQTGGPGETETSSGARIRGE